MRANRRLVEPAEELAPAGLLYGPVIANLLPHDDRLSGALPNRGEAMAYGFEVTRFVVERMPVLRWIMCLGLEAGEAASAAVGLVGEWEEHRRNGHNCTDPARGEGRLRARCCYGHARRR
jgi:hypothetical protein